MAPKLPAYYAVDESANFIDTNAKTQTDVLYFERDTGKYKLGNGERYVDVPYSTPSTEVIIDQEIVDSLGSLVDKKVGEIAFEPPIEKKSAFNADFGDTVDSVARGKHTHKVSEIKDLLLPEGVNFPETAVGEILFDNRKFGKIPTVNTPKYGDPSAISSSWAAMHESSGNHVTQELRFYMHPSMSVSGYGLVLSGQELSLRFGRTIRDVCPGDHEHTEYADKVHSHDNSISPDRLPAISKKHPGAVPPTGSPTGKCLHDDGSWKYQQALSLVQLTSTWIAPCNGEIVFVHGYSKEKDTAVILINGGSIARLDTNIMRNNGFCDAKKTLSVPFSYGDRIEVSTDSTSVQMGILLTR